LERDFQEADGARCVGNEAFLVLGDGRQVLIEAQGGSRVIGASGQLVFLQFEESGFEDLPAVPIDLGLGDPAGL
jgi:hypothetical protein